MLKLKSVSAVGVKLQIYPLEPQSAMCNRCNPHRYKKVGCGPETGGDGGGFDRDQQVPC